MGMVTTSYKLVDSTVKVFRDGVWQELQKVNVPDMSGIKPMELYKLLEFSTPEALAQSYVNMVDISLYQFMSQTEFTEAVYRASAWMMNTPVEIVKSILTLT